MHFFILTHSRDKRHIENIKIALADAIFSGASISFEIKMYHFFFKNNNTNNNNLFQPLHQLCYQHCKIDNYFLVVIVSIGVRAISLNSRSPRPGKQHNLKIEKLFITLTALR